MMKDLESLCNECRSNSCIEHAMGIMDEKRDPDNLSKKMSNISLTGDKQVVFHKTASLVNTIDPFVDIISFATLS